MDDKKNQVESGEKTEDEEILRQLKSIEEAVQQMRADIHTLVLSIGGVQEKAEEKGKEAADNPKLAISGEGTPENPNKTVKKPERNSPLMDVFISFLGLILMLVLFIVFGMPFFLMIFRWALRIQDLLNLNMGI
ncbi:uncharacterized protein RJT20DRAFT_1243 [Scheffersomyces xylosifermentans]|uniref:uncharacterized protein n=1 Tax=Scheffersomyces xylosifermentans TaxID=1304137 RepID=UPI00315CA105